MDIFHIFGEYTYYVMAVVVIIVAVFVLRLITGCFFRIVVAAILIALLAFGYAYYFDPELLDEIENVCDDVDVDKAKKMIEDVDIDKAKKVIEDVEEKIESHIDNVKD